MMGCEQVRARIQAYVDGEAPAGEQLAIEAHLLECEGCRAEHDEIRQVVDTVRGAKPLYQPSEALGRRIEELVRDHRMRLLRRRWSVAAVIAASLILAIAGLPRLHAQRFTAFAVDAHVRFASGSLPLGIVSEEPGVVSRWLGEHARLDLALPNHPAEAKGYRLVGARLMRYQGENVAYLAYIMNNRPISLVVTPRTNVMPERSEAYRSGALMFHISSENGLKLITWTDRGLSYALISDLEGNGAQSCVVCHGTAAEREKFERLAPAL